MCKVISASSPVFSVVTVFHFSHFDSFIRISHYSFHLFPWWLTMPNITICHLYILSGKMSLHDLCPFSNWIFWFSLLNFESSLHILDKSFVGYTFCNYFFPVCSLSFHSLNGVPPRAKTFNFAETQLVTFPFYGLCFWHHV